MAIGITVLEAHELIRSGQAVLIDVREAEEFKAEHISYAMSVPLSALEGGFKTLDIPETTTILFQCLKGTRGQMACERVQEMGSCKNKILNIEGGIEAWKNEELLVIGDQKAPQKISIFRQVQIIVGFLIALNVLIGFTVSTVGFVIAGVFGAVLCFAGLSGWCGLAMVLSKTPWNK